MRLTEKQTQLIVQGEGAEYDGGGSKATRGEPA